MILRFRNFFFNSFVRPRPTKTDPQDLIQSCIHYCAVHFENVFLCSQSYSQLTPNSSRMPTFETINGADKWDKDWKIVSLNDCQKADFNVHSEDTIILSAFSGIRHYTEGASYQSSGNKQPTNASGASPTKMPRTHYKSKGAPYDRIFAFIDLSSPGLCFNVISQTPSESDRLMKFAREFSSVGDLFGIVEPDMPTPGIQNVLTIKTIKPIVPLKWKDSIIPSVPLRPPPRGQQRYFILKSTKVNIHKVNVMTASCKGQFCDRQKPPSRNIGCGCLFVARAADLVFEMHVKFTYEDHTGNMVDHIVCNFRSWRTTGLFVKPIAIASDLVPFFSSQKKIRAVVRKITEKINAGGGWTILGWYRKGEVDDASAPSNETGTEIEGSNRPIHIAYLYPSNNSILATFEADRFDSTEVAAATMLATTGSNTSPDNSPR